MTIAYPSDRSGFFLLSICVSSLLVFTACIRKTNSGCTTDAECGANAKCAAGNCVMNSGLGGSDGQGGASSGGTSTASGGKTETVGSGGVGTGQGGKATGGGGEMTASGGAMASGGSGGGAGPKGGASGSGGGNASGGAPPLVTEMIDDMEDGDGRILMMNGRQGPWHTFNSGESTQMPAGPSITPEMAGANGSMLAMHTSGKGFAYAGIGFDLSNADTAPESAQSKAYDASAWTGVVFMAKGGPSASAKLRIEIPMRDFVPSDRGGTCSGSCWNVYGFQMPMALGSSWQEVKVPFSSLVREDGSTKPAFDSKQIMSISFKQQKDDFDFWIDDVRFYKE
ncbi:MAG TPA: carbohydrate binding domain-containing protein [Polyangiaceae bacterium]|nr:carbohydrate binding domain-containing protein [Polyangiaceae bacterium]